MSKDKTTPGPGSSGTEGVWQDIDRAYATEHANRKRTLRTQQQQISFAAMQFQSQMLGLMLLGEAEQTLVPEACTNTCEDATTDDPAAAEAVEVNP